MRHDEACSIISIALHMYLGWSLLALVVSGATSLKRMTPDCRLGSRLKIQMCVTHVSTILGTVTLMTSNDWSHLTGGSFHQIFGGIL